MDTKSLLIETATTLFQQKGYKTVGLNEILKACNVTKGALYHHFPNGKDELLITCLNALKVDITTDIEAIFSKHPSTKDAIISMIDTLIQSFEKDGTITGYTFSSIVSEMATMSEPVRNACSELYENIEHIYYTKLLADGFSDETATALSLLLTSTIEGAMMLCLTQQSTDPLKTIANLLPNLLEKF
ncbi:TetR/AcrR family transcriptional regulator [Psychrobacillus sp. OK032]|uniref:TetR/AcrR family transcriptional regulator n=1 Tax=Psychrobacillus sp. OK032 TaxID=1884358 RepID=UPI0008AE06F1|nr:TetR/AcrR family transcriptional regulator [Psychrobacillus sp. OK032]SES38326.1 transcriptional regulator, TetR family [Psychrobacillus sp. OK032]